MPSIPISRRQVQERSLTGGTLSSSAPTLAPARIAGGLEQINKTVSTAIDREKAKTTKIKTDGADLQLRKLYNKTLFDPNNGYSSTVKGEQTVKDFDRTQFDYEQSVKQIIKESGGTDIQDRVSQMAERYKIDLDLQMGRHTGREMEKHDTAQTNAVLKEIVDTAILSSDTAPAKIALTKGNVEDIIFGKKDKDGNIIEPGFATRKGLSKEVANAMVLETTSKLHSGVMSKMLNNGEDLNAKEYMKQVRESGQIDAQTATGMDRMIRAASIKGESQRQVQALDPNLSFTESIEKLKTNNKDPDVRDASVARYKTEFRDTKIAKDFNENQYFQGKGDEVFADPENFELTAEDNAKMSFSQQKQLMGYRSSLINAKRGVSVKTNWEVYGRLLNLSSTDLAKEKIYTYYNDLAPTEIKEFQKLQKDNTKHQAAQSLNSFVTQMVEGADGVEGFEDESSLRNQFSAKLNTYPKELQGREETWNQVMDGLYMRQDKDWSFSTPQTWKVRKDNIKTSGPVNKPSSKVPERAVYVDKIVNGRRIFGWEDKEGRKVYDRLGNVIENMTKNKLGNKHAGR